MVRQLAITWGTGLGIAAALYVLARLGGPMLVAFAVGQGVGVSMALLGALAVSMVAVGWWAPRCLS